ncbi:unnamed protein product, partial [Rotaria magnacalcarata]
MHDFQSLQLDDEDSSKYFINYISEDSDGLADDNNTENEHEHVQSPDNHDDVDES